DIAGKAWGVPVYQLLGGKQRDVIPGFATAFGDTGDDMLAQVRLLVEHQWTAVRAMPVLPNRPRPPAAPGVWEPRETLAPTAEALVKIREAFGSALMLGLDYHHRLSLAETASFCQRLPSGTLDFLEEPIRDESPEAYAA